MKSAARLRARRAQAAGAALALASALYAFRGGAEQVYRCAACGRRVFRTNKRYSLFLCWDEEPQPGEDATLLLAGRLRHRHCASASTFHG